MQLSDIKKASLFKTLVDTPLYQAGIAFGFDKHYKDPRAVKNAVYRIYKDVTLNPGRYGVQEETVELVRGAVTKRAVTVVTAKTLAEASSKDIKELALSNRDKAAGLIEQKLDRIGRSKKALDEVPLGTLATTYGILFDKAQIIQGQATENVAVLARIDKDMSAEEALSMVLKSRELTQLEKEAK